MLQNVEYHTLPLDRNVKFWQHFWAEKILKSSNKKQRYLIIIWLHANYSFYMKIHVKCEYKLWKKRQQRQQIQQQQQQQTKPNQTKPNKQNKTKQKTKTKTCGMWDSPLNLQMEILFVIDETAILKYRDSPLSITTAVG